jgi:hypothetical protein
MVLGMSLATFTALHVVISLIAIATGLVVAAGMLSGRRLPGWTAVFLVTTVLTSVTGFFFPFTQVLPSHMVGAFSLVVLALALAALYGKGLAGSWRGVYVIGSIFALYLNVFVLVVQAFLKIPALNRRAPTGSELPFAIAQLVVLALFIWLGVRALRRFHPVPVRAA